MRRRSSKFWGFRRNTHQGPGYALNSTPGRVPLKSAMHKTENQRQELDSCGQHNRAQVCPEQHSWPRALKTDAYISGKIRQMA
eukprot:1161167-Pelagomonas_calceolata.AAC.3